MQQKNARVTHAAQRLRDGHSRLPTRKPDMEDVTVSPAYRRVVIGNQTKQVQRPGELTKTSRFRHACGTDNPANLAAPPVKLSLQVSQIPALKRVFCKIRELAGRPIHRRQTRPLGL